MEAIAFLIRQPTEKGIAGIHVLCTFGTISEGTEFPLIFTFPLNKPERKKKKKHTSLELPKEFHSLGFYTGIADCI